MDDLVGGRAPWERTEGAKGPALSTSATSLAALELDASADRSHKARRAFLIICVTVFDHLWHLCDIFTSTSTYTNDANTLIQ